MLLVHLDNCCIPRVRTTLCQGLSSQLFLTVLLSFFLGACTANAARPADIPLRQFASIPTTLPVSYDTARQALLRKYPLQTPKAAILVAVDTYRQQHAEFECLWQNDRATILGCSLWAAGQTASEPYYHIRFHFNSAEKLQDIEVGGRGGPSL